MSLKIGAYSWRSSLRIYFKRWQRNNATLKACLTAYQSDNESLDCDFQEFEVAKLSVNAQQSKEGKR